MSLIYRAIWMDDRSNLLDIATETFVRWASEKHPGGLTFGQDPAIQNGVGSSIRRADVDGVLATEAVLVEESGGDRWMTRQRVLVTATGEQWMWVDLERTTTEVFRRQDVIAPRLVREHLDQANRNGGQPRVGTVLLRSRAHAMPAEQVRQDLVDLIRDPSRTIPIVVFSHDENLEPSETMRRATTTQEILAGVAHVVALTPSAQREFTEQLGPDLSVWGGAARVYLPGSLDPWRHRYYRRDVVEKHPREVGRRIAFALSGAIAARRSPAPYETVQLQLRGVSAKSPDELLAVAEIELAERDRLIEELRAEISDRDETLLDRAIDIDDLNSELEAERKRTRYWQMRAEPEDGSIDPEVHLPEQVVTLSEAAAFCQQYLPLVCLPPEALRDLDELDAAPEATAWAKTSWRGFRALSAYASNAAGWRGGFWDWCATSNHPDVWPATTKKLSMTESETVLNNSAQRAARYLPVDQGVSETGKIEMLAHMKIAQGGGSNIPRIYFHDDTKGATGKIHVGFFGPHRYMENSKS
jgi:hypothetical protein